MWIEGSEVGAGGREETKYERIPDSRRQGYLRWGCPHQYSSWIPFSCARKVRGWLSSMPLPSPSICFQERARGELVPGYLEPRGRSWLSAILPHAEEHFTYSGVSTSRESTYLNHPSTASWTSQAVDTWPLVRRYAQVPLKALSKVEHCSWLSRNHGSYHRKTSRATIPLSLRGGHRIWHMSVVEGQTPQTLNGSPRRERLV